MSIRLVLPASLVLATTVGASMVALGQSASAQTAATQASPSHGSPTARVPSLRSTLPSAAGAATSGAALPKTADKPADTSAASGAAATEADGAGEAWSREEVAEASAHCAAVLKGIDAVTLPEPPIRQGSCGAPAVVKVVSIGRSPAIALNPPAVLSCDMVVALHKWFKADVQPLARTHLGGSIVKIEVMSSYSCRNAYGRTRTNLSEHGRANALDIGGFATASADTTRVLASWGTTAREIKALAAKSDAAKSEAERAATAGLPKAPGPSVASTKSNGGTGGVGGVNTARSGVITGSTATATSSGSSASSTSQSSSSTSQVGSVFSNMPNLPGVIVRMPNDGGGLSGFGLAPPSRLGGAKPAAGDPATGSAAGAQSNTEARRTLFLHETHASACKYFGTVLGPEANRDHRNHFHLDLAPRKSTHICQ